MDGKAPQAVVGDSGSEPITLRTIVTGVRRAGACSCLTTPLGGLRGWGLLECPALDS